MIDTLRIDISKTMAYALRHNPIQYGLDMDEYGFVSIDKLLKGLSKNNWKCKWLVRKDIEEVVAKCPEQRYEIIGDKIRAKSGHNKLLDIKIKKTPIVPPAILYHGTTPDNAAVILKEGLKSMNRQYANLSSDIETAVIVGKRRCTEPVVLIINAKLAHEEGVEFYLDSINKYSVAQDPDNMDVPLDTKYIAKLIQ